MWKCGIVTKVDMRNEKYYNIIRNKYLNDILHFTKKIGDVLYEN